MLRDLSVFGGSRVYGGLGAQALQDEVPQTKGACIPNPKVQKPDTATDKQNPTSWAMRNPTP